MRIGRKGQRFFFVDFETDGLASRIDRFDWLDVLRNRCRMTIATHGLRSLADYYRRVHSQDSVELADDALLMQLEPSAHAYDVEDPTRSYTYQPKEGDPQPSEPKWLERWNLATLWLFADDSRDSLPPYGHRAAP